MVSTRGTFEGLCDPLYGWQSVANCCQKSVLPRRSGYLISVCIELNKVFWFFFFFCELEHVRSALLSTQTSQHTRQDEAGVSVRREHDQRRVCVSLPLPPFGVCVL